MKVPATPYEFASLRDVCSPVRNWVTSEREIVTTWILWYGGCGAQWPTVQVSVSSCVFSVAFRAEETKRQKAPARSEKE